MTWPRARITAASTTSASTPAPRQKPAKVRRRPGSQPFVADTANDAPTQRPCSCHVGSGSEALCAQATCLLFRIQGLQRGMTLQVARPMLCQYCRTTCMTASLPTSLHVQLRLFVGTRMSTKREVGILQILGTMLAVHEDMQGWLSGSNKYGDLQLPCQDNCCECTMQFYWVNNRCSLPVISILVKLLISCRMTEPDCFRLRKGAD